MSDLLAYDIALIPDEPSRELLIAANRSMEGSDLCLSHDHHVPHITVAMGIATSDELASLFSEIESFSIPRQVHCKGISERTSATGKSTYYLDIVTEDVRQFHNDVMEIRSSIEHHKATLEHFAETVSPGTVEYVNNFQEYSGDEYHPHVTLGYAKPRLHQWPEVMNVKLAIYQLGNHCTCAKLILPK